jgi:hypothetical protein
MSALNYFTNSPGVWQAKKGVSEASSGNSASSSENAVRLVKFDIIGFRSFESAEINRVQVLTPFSAYVIGSL